MQRIGMTQNNLLKKIYLYILNIGIIYTFLAVVFDLSALFFWEIKRSLTYGSLRFLVPITRVDHLFPVIGIVLVMIFIYLGRCLILHVFLNSKDFIRKERFTLILSISYISIIILIFLMFAAAGGLPTG